MNDIKRVNRNNHLLNIILLLFFILPQNMFFYLFVPVSMLFLYDGRMQVVKGLNVWIHSIFFTLVISLLINILEPWYAQKGLIKAIQLVLLLYTFGRIKSFKIIKGYLIFLLTYLALFQFAYQLNIPFIGNIMNFIYPLSEDQVSNYSFVQDMSFSDIGGYTSRLGGIYYNPNICAFFLECLLLIFLQERNQFKTWEFIISIIVLLACILSTGSRTSFLVLVLIVVFNMSNFNAKSILSVSLFVMAFLLINVYLSGDVRIFQVSEGMNDSFGAKVAILLNYLSQLDSLLKYLFGSFSTMSLPYLLGANAFAGTDFEIGDVIVSYGILGLICIIGFLAKLFFTIDKNYRVFYCILLWSFSNTIFMSYRASSVFLLILSIYYLRSNEDRKKKMVK